MFSVLPVRDCSLICAFLVVGFSAETLRAESILYSTLGPGGSYSVGDIPHAAAGPALWVELAMGFSPSSTAYFSHLDLPASRMRGQDVVNILLVSDSGGVPGPTLETFSLIGQLSDYPSASAMLSMDSVLNPLLVAGEHYWIQMVVPTSETTVAWYVDEPLAMGRSAFRSFNTPDWAVNPNTTQTAFQVLGTPIPEPVTWVLMASGLAALAGLRRISNRR